MLLALASAFHRRLILCFVRALKLFGKACGTRELFPFMTVDSVNVAALECEDFLVVENFTAQDLAINRTRRQTPRGYDKETHD